MNIIFKCDSCGYKKFSDHMPSEEKEEKCPKCNSDIRIQVIIKAVQEKNKKKRNHKN